jgi:hypothetical protein
MSTWGDLQNYVGAIGQTFGSFMGLFTEAEPPADTSVIRLTTELNGAIVGGLIPGIVQSSSIRQHLDVDRVPIVGRSGTGKLINGWSDAELTYELRLTSDDLPDGIAGIVGQALSFDFAGLIESLTEDNEPVQIAIQRLGKLNQFAKMYDPSLNPAVWTISEELANAHGITRVIFQDFNSTRTSRLDVIDVTLTFLEFVPSTVMIETGMAAPPPPPESGDDEATNPLE